MCFGGYRAVHVSMDPDNEGIGASFALAWLRNGYIRSSPSRQHACGNRRHETSARHSIDHFFKDTSPGSGGEYSQSCLCLPTSWISCLSGRRLFSSAPGVKQDDSTTGSLPYLAARRQACDLEIIPSRAVVPPGGIVRCTVSWRL